ncbi:hypothetical protein [Streptomyces sp. NPDC046985]|uniref:hypothetical protein n=1 Tax=Streptomyces sp. NPDC046985 TaxID=3155377 RepID=UPI00340ED95B
MSTSAGTPAGIDVSDPRLAFRRVTLDQLTGVWATEAATITTAWCPPAPQSQPGSTISSPSP